MARDDDEDELLDGQHARLPLMLKDAMPNGLAGTGHRPGFAIIRDDASRARVAAAYEACEISQQNAWRGPINNVADEATDTAVADAAAHADRAEPRPMQEVYRLYDETLRAAWKMPR
jgi:hypothetical protein